MSAANSRKTPVGVPFKKGVSGNPNGRPKLPEEFVELARSAAIPALKRTIELMQDPDGNIALKATDIVMSRAWGKPQQSVDVTHHKSPLDDLDAASLRDLVQAIARRRADPDAGSGEAALH